jgi:hypothetical protein
LAKTAFALLVLAFVLVAVAYAMLRANGVATPMYREGHTIVSDTREISKEVRSVEMSGPMQLTLRQGATASLTVKGEKRLLGIVDTTQEGENLHIGINGMLLHHRDPIQVELVLPALENLVVDSSGNATVNGFAGEHIQVSQRGSGSVKFNGRYKEVLAEMHGSGDLEVNTGVLSDRIVVQQYGPGSLTVTGTVKEFTAEQSGSGEIDAQHLAADNANLDQRGSGNASVTARNVAVMTIRGSGEINVYGEPKERTVTRTGSGEVNFLH